MAFNKKTWKARQGLGLNKFSIDGATPVPITNQPDSVTQQGDALSAGNLNDLEDRIAEAFDDVENEKADKSTTDDLQNQIVNLNTSVATLDAIVGGEAEVENVDPSEGQSILSASRLIHHVNLLPSGEFGLVGARDIVHEGSIVNLNPTGFFIRGINLWDEAWEVGSINDTTGALETSTTQIRNKNKIPVMGGQSYYILMPNGTGRTYFFDLSDNLLSVEGINQSVSAPSGASYMRFRSGVGYGPSYLDNIQIADNTLPSSVKSVYHPFSGQTVPVSISGHYVNENVFDYVTNKTVDGVLRGEVHTKVGEKNDNFNWTLSEYGYWRSDVISDIKYNDGNTPANIICDKYVTYSSATLVNTSGLIGIAQASTGRILARTGDTSNPPSIATFYELATEVVTYGEPLRSFSVSDYCTIEPITPQTIANRIDVPFSVLSKSNNGLIEQIRTNTADIADNKQILAQHEARIANLEQISGDYVTEEMQDYSSVPTGKASFALVETLKGVSRVENQLMPIVSSFSRSSSGVTYVSDGNGKYSISGLSSGISETRVTDVLVFPKGHRFLIATTKPMSYGTARIIIWVNDSQFAGVYYGGQSDSASDTAKLFTIDDSWFNETIWFNVQNGKNPSISDLQIIIHDLTQYFSSDPSVDVSTLTISDIQSKYPELLMPSDYNAGEIVDATYSAVKSKSRNLYNKTASVTNERWFTTGTISASGTTRSEAIPIRPNTLYYFKNVQSQNVMAPIFWFDINMNYISNDEFAGSATSGTKTSPNNAYYVGVNIPNANAEICCVNVSDSRDGEVTDFFTDTLPIPSVTLKGAGSVSDILDVESGVVTRRIGSYTFTGNETPTASYQRTNGDWYCIFQSIFSGGKNGGEGLSDKGIPFTTGNVAFNGTGSYFVIRGEGGLAFYLAGATSASDVAAWISANLPEVYFELATPTTESVTPTLDNTLRTEGGGTVYSDAEVDGQFTLGFLNL